MVKKVQQREKEIGNQITKISSNLAIPNGAKFKIVLKFWTTWLTVVKPPRTFFGVISAIYTGTYLKLGMHTPWSVTIKSKLIPNTNKRVLTTYERSPIPYPSNSLPRSSHQDSFWKSLNVNSGKHIMLDDYLDIYICDNLT